MSTDKATLLQWLNGLDDPQIDPRRHPVTSKVWTKKNILEHHCQLLQGADAHLELKAEPPISALPAPEARAETDLATVPFYAIDWFELAEKYLKELAPTTDKFWPAKFAKGDYHENMDHHAFFKWQVSVFKTYPLWCLEQQSILDRQRELNVPLPKRLSEFDFYDRANSRPTRSLDMYMDNAPYHAFGSSHITNMTKEEIAVMLRALGEQRIIAGGCEYLVPSAAQKWKPAKPSASELQAAVIELFTEKKRYQHFLEPPYMIMVNRANDEQLWGPVGKRSWTITFSAPYCPNFIPKELHWADGKNHLANPANRKPTDPL